MIKTCLYICDVNGSDPGKFHFHNKVTQKLNKQKKTTHLLFKFDYSVDEMFSLIVSIMNQFSFLLIIICWTPKISFFFLFLKNQFSNLLRKTYLFRLLLNVSIHPKQFPIFCRKITPFSSYFSALLHYFLENESFTFDDLGWIL